MWEKCRALLVLCAFGFSGCAARTPAILRDTLNVTSTGFSPGGVIPIRYTCNGSNISPPLAWHAPPPDTRSLALVVTDRDSPLQFLLGSFVHWIVYNIPPQTRELPENLGTLPSLADGTREGSNGFDKVGFGGPCPPGSGTHRYAFAVYALDSKPDLAPGIKLKALDAAIEGHVLAQGILVGHYR